MNEWSFPQPPWNMVMPPTAQLVSTVCLATVALIMFSASLTYWLRTRNPLFVLGMVGGLVACVNEPFTNVVGMCFHPVIGQWEVISSFDRPIPVWAVLCYPVYFGGLTCLMLLWLRKGVTRARFWLVIGVIMIGNAAFEFPILAAHVYVYYGEQPYRIFGMQPTFFVINALGAVLGAVVMAYLEPRLAGWRRLLLLLVPLVTQLAAYGVAAPHIFTLNTDLPIGVKYVGTTLTIALGLAVLDLLSRYAERQWPPVTVVQQQMLAVNLV